MANEILMEYAGSLHCDSYPVYSRIEKATILDWLEHYRRYFVETLEVRPLHKRAKKLKGEAVKAVCDGTQSLAIQKNEERSENNLDLSQLIGERKIKPSGYSSLSGTC